MKASLILLGIAIALLAVGLCLDGIFGAAVCTVANVLSLTVIVREARRGRESEVEDDDRQ